MDLHTCPESLKVYTPSQESKYLLSIKYVLKRFPEPGNGRVMIKVSLAGDLHPMLQRKANSPPPPTANLAQGKVPSHPTYGNQLDPKDLSKNQPAQAPERETA